MPRTRVSLFAFLLTTFLLSGAAHAQNEGEDTSSPSASSPEEGEGEEAEPKLRPPAVSAPELESEADEKKTKPAGDSDPGEDSALMTELAPDDVADGAGWTAPQTSLGLDGYFRSRFEVFENFSLGRVPLRAGQGDLPFSRFIPIDNGVLPSGGCDRTPTTSPTASPCTSSGMSFASMRLRLSPTVNVSDDVRVHMTFDVFDNLVLGSTPTDGVYAASAYGGSTYFSPTRTADDVFSSGQDATSALRDSIVARRVWAEVSNRDLGQLSFGRMGAHWGLGLVHNAGNDLDDDKGTEVDRVMLMTRLFGITWLAAHDFAGEGVVFDDPSGMSAVPFDLTNRDDISQWVFGAARRMEPSKQAEELRSGGWVLNAGAYFIYRNQLLTTSGAADPLNLDDLSVSLVHRDANIFTPDLWAQFLWGDLRVEVEAAVVAGSIDNIEDGFFTNRKYTLLQFGGAFEAEYRLLDRKLALRLYGGLATGDSDVDGLSAAEGVLRQQTTDTRISTFQFNPAYRIDLILWRNLMERVAGAWYVRPGVGYDIIKNENGLLLGGQLDIVYSRAMNAVQTYGSSNNLGIEGNATVYFRTADGPGPTDGFYAQVQYGMLVPLKGLGYPTYRGVTVDGAPTDLSLAHAFRVLAAVKF